jgi:hypothetical protein
LEKRKAVSIAVISLLLSLTLCGSTPIAPVKATGGVCASILYGSQWGQTEEEWNEAWTAVCLMYDFFEPQWHPYYGQVYDHLKNYYAQITESLVRSEAAHCEDYQMYATVFYHGHGGKTTNPPHRYFIYEQGPSPDHVDDYQDIYPFTKDKHYFVFLWACAQGNEVGHSTPKVHGMPYSWTHRYNLDLDGYKPPNSGDYCFIGFENVSRPLSYWIEGGKYRYWLVFFYYFALTPFYYGPYTINEALDAASQVMWDKDFDETELYRGYTVHVPGPPPMGGDWESKMHVYGNGDNYLPVGWW